MTDPRVAAVEDNLLAFFGALPRLPMFRRFPATDVEAIQSDVPFPMFNTVTGARFGSDATRRTEEVADSFIAEGVPWMWWLTPSHTSPELESALESRGLQREEVPGMYAELAPDAAVQVVDGLTIEHTEDAPTFIDVMLAGFGMPEFLRAPMTEVMSQFTDAINLVASLHGRTVGCGMAYVDGPTAGLYNIATVEEARGRGIGYAVTQALMSTAHEAGARHVVLHASESGKPVYQRAGFVEVCQVPQYIWMPDGN